MTKSAILNAAHKSNVVDKTPSEGNSLSNQVLLRRWRVEQLYPGPVSWFGFNFV